MKNHCGTIVLVLLVIFIFCFNSYAAEQPSQKQVKSMPWLSLLLTDYNADYSGYFSKVPFEDPIISNNNNYQPGSTFSLMILNTSTRIFNLTRAELRNGGSILGYTTSPAQLAGSIVTNGGQLNPGEFVNVTFIINVPVPVVGIKFIYYLRDQTTGNGGTVSHEY